jgi:hypothetical protein
MGYTVYSPNDVIVTVNLFPIVGWETITISKAEDNNSMQVGVDGSFRHIHNLNNSGTVTIELLDYSPSNDIMGAAALLSVPFIVCIIDKSSQATTFTADSCMLTKTPDLVRGKEGGVVSWVFNFGSGITTIAGARSL